MKNIRSAIGLLSASLFFAVSAFAPIDRPLGQDSELIPTGHGTFIENVGQFSGGDFLLRGDSGDFWFSGSELRVSQSHVSTDENGEPVTRLENFFLEFDGANPAVVMEPFGRLDSSLSYLIGSDPEKWHVRVPVWSGLRIRNLYDGINLIIYGESAGGGLDWTLDAVPGADLSVVNLQGSGVPSAVSPTKDLQLFGILGNFSLRLPSASLIELIESDINLGSSVRDAEIDAGKLNSNNQSPSGGVLQAVRSTNYMSFLGGTGQDKAYSVAAEDGFGYVAGYTNSIDFPLTAGVVDTTLEGSEAFVVKVNAVGDELVYATFLGGELTDIANDIAVEDGIAYITGSTDSTSFPGLAPWEYLDKEVFVVSLTADGTGIRYARRFGGTTVEPDEGYGIAVEAGNAYITGLTYSTILTSFDYDNPPSTILKGDIFTIKINSAGIPNYISIHGGNGLDSAYDIAVSGGAAYITGQSESKTFMGPFPAGFEAFVLKIDAVGGLERTTILSGSGMDRGNGIALDSAGNIYVAGATDSSSFMGSLPANLPYGGLDDGFIVRLNSTGTPNFRTFLGGSNIDRAYSLAVDSGGGVQVIGLTHSSDFPFTADRFDSTLDGNTDAFVVRVLPGAESPLDFSTYIGGSSSDSGLGLALDINGSTFISGDTTSSDFPLSLTPFDATYAGAGEGFVGKLSIGPVPGVVLKKFTNGVDADIAPGPYILSNSPVTWEYEIYNTGSAQLNAISLTDNDLGAITCPSTTLAPGFSMSCSATGNVTSGQYENIGTVVAQPSGGLPSVNDEDYSHYFGADPLIAITATTAGLDGRVILVGQTAAITYLVKNTGNVPLGSVSVTDTAGIPVSCPQTTLTPNEEITCTSSILVVAGSVSHTANVTASPPSGLPAINASDPTSHFGAAPSIVLTNKVSVNGGTTWNDSNTTPTSLTLLTGNAPKFQLSVYNSGNVALTNIAVSGCPTIASLAIGATSTPCVLTGTWESGERQNLKSATGSYTDGLSNVLALSSSDSAYYFGANPTLSIQKEISLNGGSTWLDTSAGEAPTLLSGTNPQYRITVQNPGNVALLTTISDPAVNFGTNCQPMTLQPSGTQICTATKTWAANLQTNTAHTTAAFTDSGGHSINIDNSDTAKYFGTAPSLSIEKYVSVNGGTIWFEADDATGPYLLSGHAAPQYKVTITNSGNVQLTGISVTDSVLTLSGCTTTFDLAPSGVNNCTASAVWSAGSHENTASLTATFTDSAGHVQPFGLSDTAHYFGALPGLTVSNMVSVNGGTTWVEADTATGPTLLQGYSPMYRVKVDNTGNVPLAITLTGNPLVLPAECAPGILAGGSYHECTFSGTWGSGQKFNNALASANYTDGAGNSTPMNANNYAYYFGAQPLLDLEKYVSGDNGTTWNDADTQTGPYFLNTAALKYKLVLDNTGNVTLSGLTWSDPAFSLTGCTLPSTLTPEAAPVECILAGTWAVGQVDNLASAGGSYTDGAGHLASPSDTDAAHFFGAQPGVTIVKSTNGDDANTAPGPYILVGDTVSWAYTIINTGNVPLTGIAVTDDNGTPLVASDDFTASCGSTVLAVSSQETCNASGTAVEGQYTNTGTVTAQPAQGAVPIGFAISASDVSHYFGARISMTLEKTTNSSIGDNIPPGPFVQVGDLVTWNYMVANTSNINIGPIEVWDDHGTQSDLTDDHKVCTIANLSPGQSSNLNSCKWSAPAVAGQYANTGRAEMLMLDQNFSAVDMGHYYGYVSGEVLVLSVIINDQSPPQEGIYVPAGSPVTFKYSIFNLSPSPITDITLTDLTDSVSILCPVTELPALSSTTCSRTINALPGEHTHNAQVTGFLSENPETGTASSKYYGTQAGITLDVHTNGQDPNVPMDLPIKAGSPINWEYLIQNTSNIALTEILVTQEPEVTVTCPKTTLAIGESMTCTASGTGQIGAFTNLVTVSGMWPDGIQTFSDNASSHYFGVDARVALGVEINGAPAITPPGPEIIEGQTAMYDIAVTNTGNYFMDSIVVSLDGTTIGSCATSLAAGATMACEGSETASLGLHSRVISVSGKVNGETVSEETTVYYTGKEDLFFVFLPLILR